MALNAIQMILVVIVAFLAGVEGIWINSISINQ
ncbi:Uncharacterised protein [Pediococcus pentosaceus]|nr:Uncharacterised protein [Pediococcus pentosaceus]